MTYFSKNPDVEARVIMDSLSAGPCRDSRLEFAHSLLVRRALEAQDCL